MARNAAAAPGQVCPGIRIHAIDIVQPPGIRISSIADIDPHHAIVTAALAAKSSAETAKKSGLERGRPGELIESAPFASDVLTKSETGRSP
jgi:hypothetical protein